MYVKHIHDQYERRFIIKDDQNEKLGFVELTEIDFIHRRCEFAIIISPGQSGKGYATAATKLALKYAFNVLNLHKVYLIVDQHNEAAIHIYEKCGFHEEGRLIDEFYTNGEYRTAIRMYIKSSS
ncbi:GNAT family N-acetyltransferase [Candidiatus Paracoxiella cheracis]|uniref:GNAT family N-acetyltransferase n=1 Tax=Candidiatus Paracoxiella cheracis TaxID=3405120 RepID=UPI003BF50FBF